MVYFNGFEIEFTYYPEEKETHDKHGWTPYVPADWDILEVTDAKTGMELNDDIIEFLYNRHKEEITKLIEAENGV